MDLKTIKAKSRKRFLRSSLIVEAGVEDMLQKSIDMSPQEREEFITNFISKEGLKGAVNIVSNIYKLFQTMKIPDSQNSITAAIGDQGYMGMQRQKEKGERTSEPGTSDIGTILNKIGDWGVLLTFFTMLGMVGTSDYYSLVEKSPNAAAEIKSFLIFAGSAFLTWSVKYLASKWKTR